MRTCSRLLLAALVAGCTTPRASSRPDEHGAGTSDATSSGGQLGAVSSATMAAAIAETRRMQELSTRATDEAERQCERVRAHVTSLEEERAIGRMLATRRLGPASHLIADGAEASAGTPKRPLAARVERLGRAVALFSSRPDLPWTFALLERPEAEAFSEPGGSVFVTTGLLKTMKNEAELAGALAHEVAHVCSKHALTRYREARRQQCVAATYAMAVLHSAPPDVRTAGTALSDTMQYDDREPPEMEEGMQRLIFDLVLRLATSGEPGDVELETDRAAADMMSLAGYDVAAYERWLSTHEAPRHPPPADRVAKLKAYRESGRSRLGPPAGAKPRLGEPLGE